MTTNVPLSIGTGKLFLQEADCPQSGSRTLKGFVDFELCGDWTGQMLHVAAEARIEGEGDMAFYQLTIGGLDGEMHKPNNGNSEGPRYVGALGPFRQLHVQGWAREASGRWPRHIQLFLISATPGVSNDSAEPVLTI
jgi:hypothetical protein